MKNIKYILLTTLFSVSLFAQKNLKFDFEICNSDFQLYIKKTYPKEVFENFKFNKAASYSYYSDYYGKHYEIIKYNDIDSLRIIPYQYVIQYDILDSNSDIITTLKLDCRCYEKLLRIDNINSVDEILKPAVEVIKEKAITLKEATKIANEKGFSSIDEWEIDYEKNSNNGYKWFFPRLIWTLKEKVNDKDLTYYKVLEINARNGNVINQYMSTHF